MPLISGKYGLKNHFDQESGFLMRKNEKKGPEAMKPLLSYSIGQHGLKTVVRSNFRPEMAEK